MAGSYPLRPASLADVPALALLERDAFDDPWSETQLRDAMDWPGALAFVAQDEQGIAGYVLGRVIVDEGEILSLATRPESRRSGIGRQLLQLVVSAMMRRGAHAAWLEVRVSNLPARALYQSAGFVATGLRRGYYRHPEEDAVVLRRELGRVAEQRSDVR